jgi:hypothetical protein
MYEEKIRKYIFFVDEQSFYNEYQHTQKGSNKKNMYIVHVQYSTVCSPPRVNMILP